MFQSEHFPVFSCVSSFFSSLLLLTTCELALDHRKLQAVACANLLLNLSNSCFIIPKQVKQYAGAATFFHIAPGQKGRRVLGVSLNPQISINKALWQMCLLRGWNFFLQVSILQEREALADRLGARPEDSAAVVLSTAEKAATSGGPQAALGEEYAQLQKSFRRLHTLGMASSFLSFSCLLPFLFA